METDPHTNCDADAELAAVLLCCVAFLAVLILSPRRPWSDGPREWRSDKLAAEREFAKAHSKLPIAVQDKIVGYVDGVSVTAEANGGNLLIARGWAASSDTKVPVVTVVMMMDEKPLAEVTHFTPRTDVAKAYGRPDFTQSGWEMAVPSPGSLRGHQITFRAVNAKGEAVNLFVLHDLATGK